MNSLIHQILFDFYFCINNLKLELELKNNFLLYKFLILKLKIEFYSSLHLINLNLVLNPILFFILNDFYKFLLFYMGLESQHQPFLLKSIN